MSEVFFYALMAILSIATTWGMLRGSVKRLELDFYELKTDLKETHESVNDLRADMSNRIYQTRELYVPMSLFNETISELKEDQKELKEDVKKILIMLTKLNGDI